MTFRVDKASIIDHKLDDNGYLTVNAFATRAGVFVYRQPNGSVTRELRHPDEVFNNDSLSTLKMKPVVDNHPTSGRVTSENTRHLAIGWSVDPPTRADNDHVGVRLHITDAEAIKKIADEVNPKTELSCGYQCDCIKQDGEYNGEKYDHVQKNIRYNHIALVDRGRAGRKARIYLDSQDSAGSDEYDIQFNPVNKKVNSMTIKIKRDAKQTKSFKLDAMNIDIAPEAEQVVNDLCSKLDGAVLHITSLEAENDKLKADAEKYQGKYDELKTKHDAAVSPERLDEMAKDRADLCGVAGHLGMKDFSKFSNAQMKRAIVQHENKDYKMDDKSEDYIQGRYDMVVDRIKQENKGLESLATLKKVTQASHADSDDYHMKKDSMSPRDLMIQQTSQLHKQKTA